LKAAVYSGKQKFNVQDIPIPEPEPTQVLVKIGLSAICGTDVHAFMYDLAPPGTVLGHEFTGTIVQTGNDVKRWKEGDRVVGGGGEPPPGEEPPVYSHPRYNYRKMGFIQTQTRAYAEYILMEEWQPINIPSGVSDRAAAMCEPAAVAVRAIRNSNLKLGDSVGIIGGGPIGLLVLQSAVAAGASEVYLSEPSDLRQNLAKKLGASAVYSHLDCDVSTEIVKATGGIGPDVVFDCAGFPATLDQAFETVKRNGQVVLVAVPWEDMPLRPADWMAREMFFKASWGSRPENWHTALNLMKSGAINVDLMVGENKYSKLDDIQSVFEGLMKPTNEGQMIIEM